MRDLGEELQCSEMLREAVAFIGLSGLTHVTPLGNIYSF